MERLEKWKENKIVSKICAFLNSIWFAPCVAVVVLISHLSGFELPFIWLMLLAAAFSLIMQADMKPFVPIVLLIYFCIPREHGSLVGWSDIGVWSTTPYIVNLVLLAAVLVGALVFHFVYYKQYRNFKKRTFLTAGLAAFAGSYITNGFFATGYTANNLWYGLTFALLYYGFYLLIFHTVQWKKGESMRYLAQCMVVMGLLISVEMAFLYIRLPELHGLVTEKGDIQLGWGNSNSIAFTTLLGLPFAFWLAWKDKHSLLYYLAATAMVIAIFFTYARGSLIVAVPIFVAGSIFLCFAAKRRTGIWITVGIFLLAAAVVAVFFSGWLLDKLYVYIQHGINDRGRYRLWRESIQGFLDAPVFGSGQYYMYGVYQSMFFWSHNTILQIMATCGFVGLGAYLVHRVQTVIMFVKKPTSERLFAGLAILSILVSGMFDVAMICQNVILYYGIILAFAEKDFLCSTGAMTVNGEWIERSRQSADASLHGQTVTESECPPTAEAAACTVTEDGGEQTADDKPTENL